MKKIRLDIIVIVFAIIGAVYINYKLIVNRPKTTIKTIMKIKRIEVIKKVLIPSSTLDRKKMADFITMENSAISPLMRKTIVDSALKYGKKWGVDPFVILMVIDIESSFNPFAANRQGKIIGLMQINSSVWLRNKKNRAALDTAGIIKDSRQLYWISKNIEAGAYILSHYQKRCKGNINCVLRRYSGIRSFVGIRRYTDRFRKAIGTYYISEVVAER